MSDKLKDLSKEWNVKTQAVAKPMDEDTVLDFIGGIASGVVLLLVIAFLMKA